MASLIKAQIDLLALPDVRVVEMEDEYGDKQEYICIPSAKAGINRFKTKASLPIVILPRRNPISFATHIVMPDWSKDFKAKTGTAPILGNGVIKFIYYEQKQPEPFKLSNLNDE